MLFPSASSSSTSFSTAAQPDIITIDDDDEDDDMTEPFPQPPQQSADDESSFFNGDGDDGEGDGDDGGDWGDMTEVNDEADIHALPTQAHSASSASSSSRRLSSHDAVSMESCPRDVMLRIEADVREIGLLPSFCTSDINFGGRTRVALRVGFPVHSLGMNAEQVRAWYDDTSLPPTTHTRTHSGCGMSAHSRVLLCRRCLLPLQDAVQRHGSVR